MKNAYKISLFLVLTALSYYAAISFAPNSILLFLKIKNGAEYNRPVVAGLITEADREVPLPNPDFLYVLTPFDLGEGPLRVSGRMPDSSYCSVAFYAMNTRNFFILNDRDTPEKEYSVILSLEKHLPVPAAPGVEPVIAPGPTGVILVRILITHPALLPQLQKIQESFSVELLTAG